MHTEYTRSHTDGCVWLSWQQRRLRVFLVQLEKSMDKEVLLRPYLPQEQVTTNTIKMLLTYYFKIKFKNFPVYNNV